jgi:hypothetical protein
LRTLYKYLNPQRLDVLGDGRIRCTQPTLFNDPFESKPYIASMPPRELMERVSVVESARMGLSEQERLAILKVSEDPERHEMVKGMMLALFGTGVGILSLTEKPDNLLMWAHYAAEHTGYVIGFDTSHKYWNNFGDEKGNDHLGVLRKVDYSDKRPAPKHLAAMLRTEMYFTKSREWEYEQEWRVFRGVENADQVIETEDTLPICLFDFPKETVERVIIGCRASEKTKSTIAEIVRGTNEYAKTELLKAEIDDVEFKLNFRTL